MKGLAFIGMMGSGKTTISKKVAKDLDLTYFSIDQEIEKSYDMPVSAIFSVHGEQSFRDSETDMIRKLTKQKGVVLDCGGGVILNKENILTLKRNGFKVIFLNRELDDILKDIDYETRPLLKENHDHIYKIYNERIDLYFEHADIVINNTGCLTQQYSAILEAISDTRGMNYEVPQLINVAI